MKLTLWKIIGGINLYISNSSKYFVSSKLLPQKIPDSIVIKTDTNKNSDCAVVLQGPLWNKKDFTYETVKLYNRIFKGLTVIVSTWEGENKETIEKLRTLNCIVLENKKIQDGGIKNINNQITTTLAGLKKARELGKKYVLKSRGDQRLYYPDSFLFMKNMLQIFPCTADRYESTERIVVIDNYTNSEDGLKAFWVPDYFYFGRMEDIIRIFDIPFKNLSDYGNEFEKGVTYQQQFDRNVIPEIYFMKTYLSKYYPYKDLVCDDWKMWNRCKAEALIMISPWDVDLYWVKPRQRVFQPTSIMQSERRYYQTANQNLMNWIINYGKYNAEQR